MIVDSGVRRRLRYWNTPNYGAPSYSDSGNLVVTVPNSPFINGVKNPNWKVQVFRKVDASTPYERLIFDWIPKVTKTSYANNYAGAIDNVEAKDTFASTLPDVLYDDLALRDLALGRLKKKLSSRSNQMNILIPAVELHELRDTIRFLAFSATDLVYALLEIKRSKGRSAYKYAADAWLQYSFAIKPTLSDFKQIRESIDAFLKSSGDNKYTDYGAAKKVDRILSSKTFSFGLPSANQNANLLINRSLSYRFTCGYNVPMRGGNNYGADIQFGIEPGALVPALWELTSFSWLVDYFTTVGAFLDDTFVTDPVNTIYVNETKRIICDGHYTLNLPTTAGGKLYNAYTSGEGSSFRISYTKRSVLASLPTRSLRFKSADEISANAINKLLNLGSILAGGSSLSKGLHK